MAEREDRGPTGIAPEKPTMWDPSLIGALITMSGNVIDGLKGGRELIAGLKSADLFAIAIEDARYNSAGDYVLFLKFTNASGHGAYVEEITIAQKQARQGRPDDAPEVDVLRKVEYKSFGRHEDTTIRLPLLVRPRSSDVAIEVHITPTPGSWVSRDAFGQLEVAVRPLNTEANELKYLTFAIRPRP